MTVAELITKLQAFDNQNAIVVYPNDLDGAVEITQINWRQSIFPDTNEPTYLFIE